MPADRPATALALAAATAPTTGRRPPLVGAAANRKGRPRSGLALTETIRRVGEDRGAIEDLVNLAWDIALGRPVCIDAIWITAAAEARRAGLPEPPRSGEVIQPTIADIQRAWDFLGKYGFTPPVQEVKITPGAADDLEELRPDYTKLSEDELDELEAAQSRTKALQLKAAGLLEAPQGQPSRGSTSSR